MIQQAIAQMFRNNPMFRRAEQMANGKTEDELKQIANNLCKQRGIDLEEAQKQFQKQMGMFGGNNGISR